MLLSRSRSSVLRFTRAFCSSAPMVGFIGLGQMGYGMASCLAKNGHTVLGYDIVPEVVEKAQAEHGIQGAKSVEEIAEKCSVIVTMLRSTESVVQVYDTLFSKCTDGNLYIDSSTVDPATSQNLADQAAAKGGICLDAPVSGGLLKAAAGTLTLMVGGDSKGFDNAKPYLDCMGENIYHCGEKSGSGQVAKICNNLILGITMNAVGESLSLGVKLGCDPKMLTDVVNVSSGGCWVTKNYSPCPGLTPGAPGSNNYHGGFAVDLMLKDLKLAKSAAESVGQKLEFGEKAIETYQGLSENHGNKDFGIAYQKAKGALGDDNYTQ